MANLLLFKEGLFKCLSLFIKEQIISVRQDEMHEDFKRKKKMKFKEYTFNNHKKVKNYLNINKNKENRKNAMEELKKKLVLEKKGQKYSGYKTNF